MGKPRLPSDEALLIERCRCIQTFWSRFTIDVAFLDRNGIVLYMIYHAPFTCSTEGTFFCTN